MASPDYSERFPKNTINVNHAPYFPKSIRCVIAGSSGSGKTNLMMHFLIQPGMLDYSDVYIYSTTIYQPAYEYLRQYYSEKEMKIKQVCGISHKIAHFIEVNGEKDKTGELLDPSTLDRTKSHVMIFDDVMHDDQSIIKTYYCRGRHNSVNLFYLVQSLHKIQKHSIRQNANVFILFEQDVKTLKYFWETHISGDMYFKEFESFCYKVWSKGHGFVVINLWEQPYCGKYVANYLNIYVPNKYTNNNK